MGLFLHFLPYCFQEHNPAQHNLELSQFQSSRNCHDQAVAGVDKCKLCSGEEEEDSTVLMVDGGKVDLESSAALQETLDDKAMAWRGKTTAIDTVQRQEPDSTVLADLESSAELQQRLEDSTVLMVDGGKVDLESSAALQETLDDKAMAWRGKTTAIDTVQRQEPDSTVLADLESSAELQQRLEDNMQTFAVQAAIVWLRKVVATKVEQNKLLRVQIFL